MRKAGLEETQAGIKIAERNTNNLRYANDTTLTAEHCVCVCVCVCVLVAQSYPTLCDPMDCSPPGSFVHGILQARILEWVSIYLLEKGEREEPTFKKLRSWHPFPSFHGK